MSLYGHALADTKKAEMDAGSCLLPVWTKVLRRGIMSAVSQLQEEPDMDRETWKKKILVRVILLIVLILFLIFEIIQYNRQQGAAITAPPITSSPSYSTTA